MALQAPSPTGRVPAREHAPRAVVPLRIWILALAAAESVGMLAAAAAARTVTSVFGETPRGADALGALGVLVAGGLVEATGLAIATALLLGRHLPGLRRRRLAAVTVLVGATGWALGSVPGVLASTGGGGSAPPWWWVLGAGALLGAFTGALLGGSQSLVLRRLVPHPVRWALASAAGWTAAMAIIMVAATAPDAATPTVAVLGTAAAAGAVAGAVLGAVLGTAALTVDGATFTSTVVAQLLRGPARAVLGHHLVVLRVRGSASGRLREVPVRWLVTGRGGWCSSRTRSASAGGATCVGRHRWRCSTEGCGGRRPARSCGPTVRRRGGRGRPTCGRTRGPTWTTSTSWSDCAGRDRPPPSGRARCRRSRG